MFVSDIMTENVHTIPISHTLGDLRDIFKHVDYRHLLVEDHGKLVGVVSDRDVIANLSPFLGTPEESDNDRSLLNKSVAELMSRDLITVDKESLIECAAILLIENNISCLPVVSLENDIEGILSWKDLLQFTVYGAEESSKHTPSC